MTIPMTDLKGQYQSIKNEVDSAVNRVLQHCQFILGQEVKAFETEMAAYCGTGFAIGVASGTDALHLALRAIGVGPGDEVITTPFTFIATAGAIVNCGARPVFVDIDPETYNLDAQKLVDHLKSRSPVTNHQSPVTNHQSRLKAVIPVHLYGLPADMDPILAVAREHSLPVVEDCAQALGAEYKGRKVGSLGNAGCLSFFPAKNLGAYGDGGMVVTNDAKIAEVVDMLRKHGANVTYYHDLPGFNSRLDALQAAVLSVKLKYLDRWNDMRRRNAALYDRLLSQIPGIKTTPVPQDRKSSCNYYTVRLTDPRMNRAELRKHLESQGVQNMVYYPLSLHLQEVYKHFGYKLGDFPESEKAQEEVLSLPMYPELASGQIEDIVKAIRQFVEMGS